MDIGADKRFDERIRQPVFILLGTPSALTYKETVEVAAGQRPQDIPRVLRVEPCAKAARTDQELDHAGLSVVAGALAFGLGVGERRRDRSRAAEQIEDGVLRLVDAAGDARREAQALSRVGGVHGFADQVLIALVEAGCVQDLGDDAGLRAEDSIDSSDGDARFLATAPMVMPA